MDQRQKKSQQANSEQQLDIAKHLILIKILSSPKFEELAFYTNPVMKHCHGWLKFGLQISDGNLQRHKSTIPKNIYKGMTSIVRLTFSASDTKCPI